MYYSFQTDGNADFSISAAITAGDIVDPLTGAIISDPVDAMRVILARALNPIIIARPNTHSTSLKAAEDIAQADYNEALYPNTVVSAQFEIQPHSLSIHQGSSGSFTVDLIFLDPAYSGTVTFSVAIVGGPYSGVSFGSFSPATLSAPGSTAVLITVAGGTAFASLQLEVTATDGTFINKVIVGFAVLNP